MFNSSDLKQVKRKMQYPDNIKIKLHDSIFFSSTRKTTVPECGIPRKCGAMNMFMEVENCDINKIKYLPQFNCN